MTEHSGKIIALDIGCGHGFGTYRLLKKYHAIGVDVNIKNVQIAQTRYGVIVCVMDAENLAFRSEIAQYIEMSDVIEHVDAAPLCLAEGARVLVTGGRATIVVPTALSERLLTRLRPSYPEEISHKKIFELEEIEKIIKNNNLSITKIKKEGFIVLLEIIISFVIYGKKESTDQTSVYNWRKHKILFVIHVIALHFDQIILDTPIWWSPLVLITIPIGFIVNRVGNKIFAKSVSFGAIKSDGL